MSYDYTCSLPPFKEKNDIAYCQSIVLATIKRYGPMTDKMIAERLRLEINKITPRRGELVTMGKVFSAFKQPDNATKVKVNWWAIKSETTQQKLF